MPEGDTLHRAARRLQPFVGVPLEIEVGAAARAALGRVELEGRQLESVRALGKNLILRFERGVVLRSHLRMNGRWVVQPRGTAPPPTAWLVLRGAESEALLLKGPVLEPHVRALARLGPDILGEPPDIDAMLARVARSDGGLGLGEALQEQSLVAGIGNMWMAETLWRCRISPWRRLGETSAGELRAVLETAAAEMRASVEGGREPRKHVHGRAGLPCSRCGTLIRSRGQGDANRIAYWCPTCQPG